MSRIFKGVGRALAPVVGFALGGPVGAAIGGGLGGLASGDGVKGAALGALGGAAFGYAPTIAGASGLTGATASGLTRGIQGAALGGVGGGAKGAALGAALGGVGGYIGAGGGVPGLGNVAGASLDQTTGIAGLQGPTQGAGALGSISRATGSLGSLIGTTGGQPVRLGSLLTRGLSTLQTGEDIDEIQEVLARQSQLAQRQFQPYSQAGQQALANMQAPSLEALQNDPGYQFRLQQGNEALERSMAARGMSQSGAALKAAQEYGQALADQTYNDYFTRQNQLANYGYRAASGLGDLYTNLGNVQAAAELAKNNERNQFLSGLGGFFG